MTSNLENDVSEFNEKYSPFPGDVIFTKEKKPISKIIRISQHFFRENKRSNESYSHVAFVINSAMITEATGDKGVDICSFKDFFNKKSLEYVVLRKNTQTIARLKNATYYYSQNYDFDFLSRFIKKHPNKKAQVCSTLVANLLNNFNLTDTSDANNITPIQLLEFLTNTNEWTDITLKYNDYVELIRNREDDDSNDFIELHRENLKLFQKSKKNQVIIDAYFNKIDTLMENMLQQANLTKGERASMWQPHNKLEELGQTEYAFHDTDELEKDLFK